MSPHLWWEPWRLAESPQPGLLFRRFLRSIILKSPTHQTPGFMMRNQTCREMKWPAQGPTGWWVTELSLKPRIAGLQPRVLSQASSHLLWGKERHSFPMTQGLRCCGLSSHFPIFENQHKGHHLHEELYDSLEDASVSFLWIPVTSFNWWVDHTHLFYVLPPPNYPFEKYVISF